MSEAAAKQGSVAGRRKPGWLKVKAPAPRQYRATGALPDELEVHTVCAEARCPNTGECFASGMATFLILGDACTRGCAFCSVRHACPPGAGPYLHSTPTSRAAWPKPRGG